MNSILDPDLDDDVPVFGLIGGAIGSVVRVRDIDSGDPDFLLDADGVGVGAIDEPIVKELGFAFWQYQMLIDVVKPFPGWKRPRLAALFRHGANQAWDRRTFAS